MNGEYNGTWSGWKFNFESDNKHYTLDTPSGIRGLNVKATAKIENGVVISIQIK